MAQTLPDELVILTRADLAERWGCGPQQLSKITSDGGWSEPTRYWGTRRLTADHLSADQATLYFTESRVLAFEQRHPEIQRREFDTLAHQLGDEDNALRHDQKWLQAAHCTV